MDWTQVIRDWWVLITISVALVGTFIRYTIKVHSMVEEIARVAAHDKEILNIKADTAQLKNQMTGLREELTAHVVDQKNDISAMTGALFSILAILQGMSGTDTRQVTDANKLLLKHTLDK